MLNIRRMLALVAVVAALAVLPLGAQWPVTEKIDLDAIYRIKEEGLQRSKVMEIESYLTDVYGPRLTGSPNIKEAADWAQKTMKDWGLANVHLETWPFGRGWQNQRFTAMAVTPRAYPLIAYPKAWTPGTNGPVTGEAVLAVIQTDRISTPVRGKLRGKFVLTTAMRATSRRISTRSATATPTPSSPRSRPSRPGGTRPRQRRHPAISRRSSPSTDAVLLDEGVAALIDPSQGDGGTFFVQAGGVSRDPKPRRCRPRSCSRSSTTAASCARSRRRFRSRCRWTSTTRSTTPISTPSTSSASFRAPTRPTRS